MSLWGLLCPLPCTRRRVRWPLASHWYWVVTLEEVLPASCVALQDPGGDAAQGIERELLGAIAAVGSLVMAAMVVVAQRLAGAIAAVLAGALAVCAVGAAAIFPGGGGAIKVLSLDELAQCVVGEELAGAIGQRAADPAPGCVVAVLGDFAFGIRLRE